MDIQDPYKSDRAVIAVVDCPERRHGQAMAACARIGSFRPLIRWIEPGLDLPEQLTGLTGVLSVAVPLDVRGGHSRDPFTVRVVQAMRALDARGIPVYVAHGNGRLSALSAGGRPVSPRGGPALLKVGLPDLGSSGACVRAAVAAARAIVVGNLRTHQKGAP